MQAIVSASNDIILLKDAENRWLKVSARTLEIFGLSEKMVIGKTDQEIGEIYPQYKKYVPDLLASDEMAWNSTKQVQDLERICVDGMKRIYEVTKMPIYNAQGEPDVLVVAGRDVTQALESEQLYKSLFTTFPEGVFFLDKNGVILDVNLESENISGYIKDKLIGMDFRVLVAPESLEGTLECFREVLQGTPQWHESKLQDRGGRILDVQITGLPAKLNGEIIGIHGMIKDITEKNMLDQLRNEQTAVLAKIASGNPLEEIMHYIIEAVEKVSLGMGSVMFYEKKQNWLCFGYGPQLPEQYIEAIDEFPVGEHLASCGHAAYTKELAIVSDIEKDPSWSRWRDQALRCGLRSCWSMPILSANKDLLGTFGVYYHETRKPGNLEINMLQTFSHLMGVAIERDRQEQEIRYLANHDALTDLPNLRYFKEVFSAAIRQTQDLAVMFLDLDQFKALNDTFGHNFGDMLLQEIAKRIKKAIGKGNTVARMGGDEFILLVHNIINEQQAHALAEKILEETEKPFVIEGQEFQVTASIGISLFGKHGSSIGQLMKNADVAMYRAKEIGGNANKIYKATMDEKAYELYMLQGEFRHALEQQQFELHYQPKFNLATGRISGIEALARWNHPEKGNISPAVFIPLAEESGFILELGKWVLQSACRQVKEWRKTVDLDIQIAVNISVKQFIKQDVVALVKTTLTELELPPECLEIEITESVLSHHELIIKEAVAALQQIGVKVSIDDFGTGYASLTYLKQFRANAIKIDKSFIELLPDSVENAAIVSAVIALAHALNIDIIAEGVETAAQADFLAEKRCSEAQGYYFSKPLSADSVHKYLKQQFAAE